MAPSETHELASFTSRTGTPTHFYADHNSSIFKHRNNDHFSDDEGSNDENEHEGASVALLGGHTRAISGATDAISRPTGASQVIKGIITEVGIHIYYA
jgi:hypothetical protein